MKPTVWLVVFVGINFCEMVSNQVSKFFRCFIFVISESGTQELASCTAKAEQVSTERDGNLGPLFLYWERG